MKASVGSSPSVRAAPITLSSAQWRPTSSRTSSSSPDGETQAAAWVARVALLHLDVVDVAELGDRLGDGEADREVFQVGGGGHHHRMRTAVVEEADRRLVGGDAADRFDGASVLAPLFGGERAGGGKPAHVEFLVQDPKIGAASANNEGWRRLSW